MEIDDKEVQKMLTECTDGELSQRENQYLEFKRDFSKKEFQKVGKHFAGFANNEGGLLVFGVQDSPRKLVGMDENAIKAFKKMDNAEISDILLERFSGTIECAPKIIEVSGKKVGVFGVASAEMKPIMAIKDGECIKNGVVYYRYNGTTRGIRPTELEGIIQERIKREWGREVISRNVYLR